MLGCFSEPFSVIIVFKAYIFELAGGGGSSKDDHAIDKNASLVTGQVIHSTDLSMYIPT
jgi:hypothetical protein